MIQKKNKKGEKAKDNYSIIDKSKKHLKKTKNN